MKAIATSILVLATTLSFAQEKKPSKTKSIKTVTIKRKNISKKSDRLVFNVAKSPIAKGASTFELLKQTPLLSSSDNEKIQISGKSDVVYFINGKRTRMNGEAIEAFLKNTPAENIKKIEVVTLPGSEYNVQSSEGVVNIIMKTNRGNGINGNIKLATVQAKDNNQKLASSINFKYNKLSGNANFIIGNKIQRQDYTITNGNGASTTLSEGKVLTKSIGTGGYLNLDYEIDQRNNIGLSYNIWHNNMYDGVIDFFNKTSYTKDNQNITEYSRSINNQNETSNNHSVNLNYQWTPNTTTKLNVNTAYLFYDKKSFADNTNNQVNKDNEFVSFSGKFHQETPQTVNNFSSDAHLTKKFKSFTLGIGGNYNYTKTDNETLVENLVGDNYVKDDNRSNIFNYDEKISGVYVNLEKNFSKKFAAKIGTRIEFANSIGKVKDTDIKIERNATNILPSLSLNYNINKNHALSYGFTSRVKRPSFWEINPAREYLTTTNYVQNNPFVKSATVYNQEIMYLYKGKYFVQVQNTHIDNASEQIPLQRKLEDGSGTELRYIRTNYGTVNQTNLNIGTNNSFFKGIWNINYVVGLQNNRYRGSIDTDPINGDKFPTYTVDGSLTSLFISANNNIRLSSKKDWYLGVNYFYLSKARISLGDLDSFMALDLSVKKMANNWTFALDIKDLFKTRINDINGLQPTGQYVNINQYRYSQKAVLSVTYNFGNKKVKRMRKINTATEGIKKRTGQ